MVGLQARPKPPPPQTPRLTHATSAMLMASLDIYRPAAMEQWRAGAISISRLAIRAARSRRRSPSGAGAENSALDVGAARHRGHPLDEEMMAEAAEIKTRQSA